MENRIPGHPDSSDPAADDRLCDTGECNKDQIQETGTRAEHHWDTEK